VRIDKMDLDILLGEKAAEIYLCMSGRVNRCYYVPEEG
jgi:hypothetical protein